MKKRSLILFVALTLPGTSLRGQGTAADYDRAARFGYQSHGKVGRMRVYPTWFDGGKRFWYRVEPTASTHTFILVDAETGHRGAAFDHSRVAAELAADRPPGVGGGAAD